MYRTLDDLKKEEKGQKAQKPDKKKQPDSYTGGENSGLAVENPDDYNEILNKAQQSPVDPKDLDPSKSCKITLWRNGFQLNDEEFRDIADPQNKQFLSEVKKGQVPTLLKNKYPNGLSIVLSDKSQEVYTPPPPPPPPKYIEFSGQGVGLGQQQQQQTQVKVNMDNKGTIQLDKNKPTTNIMIRLSTGQQINVEVNLTTRVQEIYDYVKKIVNAGTRQISLISGFPPRPITNLQQTVEQADLMDSQINQTLA